MKKMKRPGENISLKTKKNEDPAIMDWINSQSNLMDSLRYLIEREICQFGVRNLQTVVPTERNGWREGQYGFANDSQVPHAGSTDPSASGMAWSSIDSSEEEALEAVQEPEAEEEELADEDIEAWV
ncbi:MAG: hypothetical protein IKE34_04510 [Paenibacillus sp.]|nr:hypothetical protein [Paenibacillus sp.]